MFYRPARPNQGCFLMTKVKIQCYKVHYFFNKFSGYIISTKQLQPNLSNVLCKIPLELPSQLQQLQSRVLYLTPFQVRLTTTTTTIKQYFVRRLFQVPLQQQKNSKTIFCKTPFQLPSQQQQRVFAALICASSNSPSIKWNHKILFLSATRTQATS